MSNLINIYIIVIILFINCVSNKSQSKPKVKARSPKVDSNKVKIQSVRESVIKICEEHSDSIYSSDLDDFKTKDYIIERYLLASNQNQKEAVDAIVRTLKFYKDEKLQEYNDQYFPSEFYAIGFQITAGRSKKDEPVHSMVMRCHYPFGLISNEMYQLARKYLLYLMYKTRMELSPAGRLGYVMMTKSSVKNLDLDYLKVFLDNFNFYQPKIPAKLLIVNLPILVEVSIRALFKSMKPDVRDNVHFIQIKEIVKYIELDQIPMYAGGTMKDHHRIPEGVKSGKCLDHLKHIPEADWDKLFKINERCIKEGMSDIGSKDMHDYLQSC